jgi:RNA polymerase sigma-70 factor (ECF subfamily)
MVATHMAARNPEEESLLRAARAGDPDAFERLVAPYQRKAYAFALRHAGDPDLAQDICQEGLIKAYLALPGFDGRSAFSTWLFRIVYTTAIDHARKRRARVPEEPFPDAGEPPEAGTEAVARFFEGLRLKERDDWLLAGMARLPPDLRSLVVLRDLQGFSYTEIADITGAPVGTVKWRLNRARSLLRGYLTEPGP